MRRFIRSFLHSDSGSVAPTVGLSLVALIAAGGLAFDYSRVAAMDTELQNAADQAALAAATQLDGLANAQTRATTAANSLVANQTRMANDAQNPAVTIASVTFYSSYTNPTTKTLATGDADSDFVEVTVNSRTARYAFTPIVAAFSGSLNARAVAGLGSAICGVVPFFICNPVEPAGNLDPYFAPGGVNPGTGIVMAEGGTQWGPGNFGFLDQLGTGANGVAAALASNALFGNCSITNTVNTQTGNLINAVRDSLNMRFDFAPVNAGACQNPPCQPSENVSKDVVRPNGGTCAWQQNPVTQVADMTAPYGASPPRYFPDSPTADLPTGSTPQIMGHPRDRCHYFKRQPNPNTTVYDFCANQRIGDGNWDRNAYFRANHPTITWATEPGLDANGDGIVTRYETYLWEAADVPNRLGPHAGNGAFMAWPSPQTGQCLAPGVAPSPTGTDRRRITAAVVNCRRVAQTPGLNGNKTIPVAGFIDVFLVEPSMDRDKCPGCTVTTNGTTYDNAYAHRNDIYVEVIGAAGTGQGGFPQISRRDVPRLIE